MTNCKVAIVDTLFGMIWFAIASNTQLIDIACSTLFWVDDDNNNDDDDRTGDRPEEESIWKSKKI